MLKMFTQDTLKKFVKQIFDFLTVRENIADILGIILILLMINPKFSFSSQLMFMVLFMLWFIFLVIDHQKWFIKKLKSKTFIFLCIFPIILGAYWITGFSLLNKHIILIPIIYLFSSYYLQIEKKETLKIFCIISMVYLMLICFVTLYKLETDPSLTRLLARGDKDVVVNVITPFTATYATVYSLMLIGLTIFGVGINIENKKKKYIIYAVSLFNVYFLFKAAYSISLILLLLGYFVLIVIKIWKKIKNKKRALIITLVSLAILFLIYFITKDIIADAVLSLVNHTDDMMQKRRIREIAELIRNMGMESEGGMLNRFKLYFLSLETFGKNPFIGVGFRDELLHTNIDVVNPIIGGHSTILDALASYGILGLSYILMIPFVYYEILKKRIVKSFDILVTIFIVFMILSLINTSQNVMFYVTMIVLIPGIIAFADREIHDEKEKEL